MRLYSFTHLNPIYFANSPLRQVSKSPRHQVALSPSRRSPTRQVAHSLPRKVADRPLTKSPSRQVADRPLAKSPTRSLAPSQSLQVSKRHGFASSVPQTKKVLFIHSEKILSDFLYIFFRQRHFKNRSQCG